MMNRVVKKIQIFGLVPLMLVLCHCGNSGGMPDRGEKQRDKGKIEALDVEKKTITILHKPDGRSPNESIKIRRTYTFDEDCEIMGAGGTAQKLGDFKIDEKVSVRYRQKGAEFALSVLKPD